MGSKGGVFLLVFGWVDWLACLGFLWFALYYYAVYYTSSVIDMMAIYSFLIVETQTLAQILGRKDHQYHACNYTS